MKFEVVTVANDLVYFGTGNNPSNDDLDVFGLLPAPTAAHAAHANFTTTPLANDQVNLSWTDEDISPNRATGYLIEVSPHGQNAWTQVASAENGAQSYTVSGLAPGTAYDFEVIAANSLGDSSPSNLATATTLASFRPALDFPSSSGFSSGASGILMLNGAAVSGSRLRLTDGKINEDRSVFTSQPQTITQFSTTFQFQLSNPVGGGFAFVIQDSPNGPNALGTGGSGLGYQGLGSSLAVKFDLNSDMGEGPDSTGVYTDGNSPTMPATNLSTWVNLHSGDVMSATISYDGSNLSLSLTDTAIQQSFFETYTGIDIPGLVGGTTAYVGFTASTGGTIFTAAQDLLSWTFTPTVGSGSNTLNLTSSASSTVYGQSVTFTATVVPVGESTGTPSGQVGFYDGSTRLGITMLDGMAVASFSTAALTAGSHTITAIYLGDGLFNPGGSSPRSQTVNQASTTMMLSSSATSLVYGQAVTFTATVVASSGVPPTGSVTFYPGRPHRFGPGDPAY
jgi:hypothetical protein